MSQPQGRHAASWHALPAPRPSCARAVHSRLPVQYFTVKMSEGVVATSYGTGQKFFIDPMKLLPLERFLPKPKGAPGAGGGRGARAVRGRVRP